MTAPFVYTISCGCRGWKVTRSRKGYSDDEFYFTTQQDLVKWLLT